MCTCTLELCGIVIVLVCSLTLISTDCVYLFLQGLGLSWESYKLENFVQRFSDYIFSFQERVMALKYSMCTNSTFTMFWYTNPHTLGKRVQRLFRNDFLFADIIVVCTLSYSVLVIAMAAYKVVHQHVHELHMDQLSEVVILSRC